MTFRDFIETWNITGSGATPADEGYAQNQLRLALAKLVREPNVDYRSTRQYLGPVSQFFPKAANMHRLGMVPVYFDPTFPDNYAAADTNGRKISIGKMGYKHRGTSGSLGATFIHEVEHVWDFANDYFDSEDVKTIGGTEIRSRHLSEFSPRLRQALRHLRDEPTFRIWNYLHRKHGRDHAGYYVDRFLNNARGYHPTVEEHEFAINAVIRRAKEIYEEMVATGKLD